MVRHDGTQAGGGEAAAEFDEDEDLAQPPSYGRIKARTRSTEEEPAEEPTSEESDQAFYIKIGLIFVGILAVIFIVSGLVWLVLGGDRGTETTVTQPEVRESADTEIGALGLPAATLEQVTLLASGNVYVLVKQKNDDKEIYRKTMGEGEQAVLEKDGPVDILFTAGEFLTIEHNGERMRPSSPGTAKITLP